MGGTFNNRRDKPPIVRLEHSHRRLEERLEELNAMVHAISQGSALPQNWAGVADVVDYLNRSVLRHEADEEETVFPRLQSHPTLRPLLQRLRDDHASQRKLVEKMVLMLEQKEQATTPNRLARTCQALSAAYLDHIAREDRQLLPAISRYCSAKDEQEMSDEMTERRDRDADQ